jgi:hypothetical protein
VTREIARVWHVCGTNLAEGASQDRGRARKICSDLASSSGAGEGNRTLMTSLEGCGAQAGELLRRRSGHTSLSL